MNAPAPIYNVRAATAADRAAIAAFVDRHPDAGPFHRLEWAEAVAEGCGQVAHLLVAEDVNGALAGLLPLTEVRSPLFGAALVSVGFGVEGGVLGRGAEPLADAAWRLAHARRCARDTKSRFQSSRRRIDPTVYKPPGLPVRADRRSVNLYRYPARNLFDLH